MRADVLATKTDCFITMVLIIHSVYIYGAIDWGLMMTLFILICTINLYQNIDIFKHEVIF